MGLDASAALRRAIDRVVTRRGVWLMAAFFLIDVVFIGVPSAVLDASQAVSNAFAIGVTSLIGFVVTMFVTVIGFRVFTDYSVATSLWEHIDDGVGIATVHLVVGSIVAAVIITLGFILIIPGVYLLVSLLFWQVFVAVEGDDFIDAFRGSWGLTEGQKWSVLFLVLGLFMVLLLINIFGGIIALVLPGLLLKSVIVSALNAFGMVFSIVAVADAYDQLV